MTGFIDCAAEYGNDLILKNQIDHSQYQTAYDAENYSVSNAFFGGSRVSFTETDADECTAAVADHYGDRQSHDSQRKYDCVCGVAVGAEITGVCNKKLVYNIVKGADQQRNNTGNRILRHQFSYAFCSQKLI